MRGPAGARRAGLGGGRLGLCGRASGRKRPDEAGRVLPRSVRGWARGARGRPRPPEKEAAPRPGPPRRAPSRRAPRAAHLDRGGGRPQEDGVLRERPQVARVQGDGGVALWRGALQRHLAAGDKRAVVNGQPVDLHLRPGCCLLSARKLAIRPRRMPARSPRLCWLHRLAAHGAPRCVQRPASFSTPKAPHLQPPRRHPQRRLPALPHDAHRPEVALQHAARVAVDLCIQCLNSKGLWRGRRERERGRAFGGRRLRLLTGLLGRVSLLGRPRAVRLVLSGVGPCTRPVLRRAARCLTGQSGRVRPPRGIPVACGRRGEPRRYGPATAVPTQRRGMQAGGRGTEAAARAAAPPELGSTRAP
jgi:hypothetical protein